MSVLNWVGSGRNLKEQDMKVFIYKVYFLEILTPEASDSTKQEIRGSSCDGTGKSGIGGGGKLAGGFSPKWVFIISTTSCNNRTKPVIFWCLKLIIYLL
jgi:hypothetical protein